MVRCLRHALFRPPESALEVIAGGAAWVAAFSFSRHTAGNSLPHNRARLRLLATQLSHSRYTARTIPASQTLTLQKAYTVAHAREEPLYEANSN